MKNKLKNNFSKLKQTTLTNASISFYVIKRKMSDKTASYSVFHVNIDKKLQSKLRNVACNKIKECNDVREYDFSTADLDEEMLGIETSETDMQAIIDSVANPNTIKEAKNVEDLYDAWMYLVRIDSGSSVLYYARQISGAWNVRKIQSISNLIWKDHILMDLSEDKFFRIDSKIDFFSFDGHIFIADKKNFETALNFRSGMEDNRDQIIEELRGKSVADNPDKIKTFVGNNIRRLRKLSQVKKAGYYRDARYLKQLREVNNKENWGLAYTPAGHIIITEENIDKVLHFLNNDRLSSKINEETFDVDAKHKPA
jgi:hypothetical protein